MFGRLRRDSAPDDNSPLGLVSLYTKQMGFSAALSQKVIRKFRKHGSAIAPRLDVLLANTKGGDDAGALERAILESIPDKNRLDCYWVIYGDMLERSAFFQGLGFNVEPARYRNFQRNLASVIERKCLSTGRALDLGTKHQGCIFFVRRGHMDIVVNGKVFAVLGPGSVFDVGVLTSDRFGVFCQTDAKVSAPLLVRPSSAAVSTPPLRVSASVSAATATAGATDAASNQQRRSTEPSLGRSRSRSRSASPMKLIRKQLSQLNERTNMNNPPSRLRLSESRILLQYMQLIARSSDPSSVNESASSSEKKSRNALRSVSNKYIFGGGSASSAHASNTRSLSVAGIHSTASSSSSQDGGFKLDGAGSPAGGSSGGNDGWSGSNDATYAHGCEYGVLSVETLHQQLDSPVFTPIKINFTQIVVEERQRVDEAIGRQKTALETHKRQIEREKQRAANAQLVAAAQVGSEHRARAAVSSGANVNLARTDLGRSALHVAVIGGFVQVVQFLLEQGADPNSWDNDGCSPLHLACHLGATSATEAIMELLLAHGADLSAEDVDMDTPFHYAAARGELQLLRCLLEAAKHRDPPMDATALRNHMGETPLGVCGSQEAKRMLKAKTNIDQGCR